LGYCRNRSLALFGQANKVQITIIVKIRIALLVTFNGGQRLVAAIDGHFQKISR